MIAEYDENGVESRSYGYKPDSTWTTDPLFQKIGSTYYWYQNDHLGTPQKLVAGDGTVVWSAQYTAFGEAVVDVQTVENYLRFPGQFYDDETGLHYNWFRYYDLGIGRYLKRDPIGFTGEDINLYGYAYNNPLTIIDPIGLQFQEIPCSAAHSLKAAFLVEYRLFKKGPFEKYLDIATIQVDNENVYFKDLLDKKYNYPTYMPDKKGKLIPISHDPDTAEQYPDWEEIEIEVPEPFTPIEMMLPLEVKGEDVGRKYGFKLTRKWDFKISGKVHANAEGCGEPAGSCVESEFRVEGNLVFVKTIIKKEKVQKLNRASAHKLVKGKIGNCAGKTYCCTFEWSKDMFQEGPLSKNQYMHMETNFKAKIHVYR